MKDFGILGNGTHPRMEPELIILQPQAHARGVFFRGDEYLSLETPHGVTRKSRWAGWAESGMNMGKWRFVEEIDDQLGRTWSRRGRAVIDDFGSLVEVDHD